jgi:hypothetical protein
VERVPDAGMDAIEALRLAKQSPILECH